MRLSSSLKGYCVSCNDEKIFVKKRMQTMGERKVIKGKCDCGMLMIKIVDGPGGKNANL